MEEELPVFIVGSTVLLALGVGVWFETENWTLFALSVLVVGFFAFRLARSRQQMRAVFTFFASEASEMDPYHAAQLNLRPPTLRSRGGQWLKQAVSSKSRSRKDTESEYMPIQLALEGLDEQPYSQA